MGAPFKSLINCTSSFPFITLHSIAAPVYVCSMCIPPPGENFSLHCLPSGTLGIDTFLFRIEARFRKSPQVTFTDDTRSDDVPMVIFKRRCRLGFLSNPLFGGGHLLRFQFRDFNRWRIRLSVALDSFHRFNDLRRFFRLGFGQ